VYKSPATCMLLSLLMLLLASCGGRVENRLNCRRVCNMYEDCVDSDYDTSDCISRCSSDAADDDDYARQVDICESCIDGRSCGEAFVACTTDCAPIVP
jgi:hypothetical protein